MNNISVSPNRIGNGNNEGSNLKNSKTTKLYLPSLKSNIKNDPVFYNVSQSMFLFYIMIISKLLILEYKFYLQYKSLLR